ncbi:MAG: 16S rRNA (cytosine(967)-C(5))-methyltransferase RsmB [Kiritimatiellia bacterium]
MTDPKAPNLRAKAAQILSEWLRTDCRLDELLEKESADLPFLMELLYGVARWKRLLMWVLRQLTKGRPDPRLIPYALVGMYQILFMDTVKAYAAVNETVEAAKEYGNKQGTGFINRILRQTVRRRARLVRAIQRQPLGIRESHPDVLLKRWIATHGQERVEALCRWNNQRAEVVVRVNLSQTTAQELRARWEAAGIRAVPHPFEPQSFLVLPRGVSIPKLVGYAEGWFSVQDPATTCAVALLNPQPGDVVLDVCAAPGGKTILIAEQMADKGKVFAVDVDSQRLGMLRQNIQRMRLRSLEIVQADATSPDLPRNLNETMFDRILLDVPCTNTGVLRRRPDARWRFSLERLQTITELQSRLLDNVSRLLKPGGILVYSTCSLEPEENELLIQRWLASHPRFRLLNSISLFPPESQTDGGYTAALRCD